jgi:hypothetical protein
MPKITCRITDRAESWLLSVFDNKTAGGEYLLDSLPQLYRRAMHQLRGRFSIGELSLMLDVMNGAWLTPQPTGHHLAANVSDGIALDRLDQKWSIDGPAFNAKLRELDPFTLACLEIWAVGFWAGDHWKEEKGMEDWMNTLLPPTNSPAT